MAIWNVIGCSEQCNGLDTEACNTLGIGIQYLALDVAARRRVHHNLHAPLVFGEDWELEVRRELEVESVVEHRLDRLPEVRRDVHVHQILAHHLLPGVARDLDRLVVPLVHESCTSPDASPSVPRRPHRDTNIHQRQPYGHLETAYHR
jgi:hypothetical protein